MSNPLAGLFDQLENFLFDLLGIVLPGFICLLILLTPLALVSLPQSIIQFNDSEIFACLQEFSLWIRKQPISNSFYGMLLISFILGHVVKVFSKVWYDFFVAIFDNSLNKLWMWFVVKIGITKERFDKKWFSPIPVFIVKQLATVFKFDPPAIYDPNEKLKPESIRNFNSYYDTDFKDTVWYPVYKLSRIVNTNENVKSLAHTYLAKYNLYRSLSFLVAINLFYDLLIFSNVKSIAGNELFPITTLIIIFNSVLWFTYHEKYKRYWTLCGDETLMAFYYFTLRKRKGLEDNKGKMKDDKDKK